MDQDGPTNKGDDAMKRTPAILMITCFTVTPAVACPNMDPPDEEEIPWLLIAPATQEAPTAEQDPTKNQDSPMVEITIDGEFRRIRSNGLPNHPTGRFPNRGNPNRISPQDHDFRIPVAPKKQERPTPVGMNMFGVALNGCFFEAGTAEWWKNDRNSGWHIEAIGPRGGHLGLDSNNAHVQPNGAYHYHAVPRGLFEILTDGETPKQPVLLGWAADGYPIYGPWGYEDAMDPTSKVVTLKPSWQKKPGDRPAPPTGPGGSHDGTYEEDFHFVRDSGHLDELNGRNGVTPEFPEGTYHYVVTDTFPFVSRFWKGSPSPGMSKRGGPPGRGAGRGSGRGSGRGRGRGRGPGAGPDDDPSKGQPPRTSEPGRAPDRPRPSL
jgi:hypothetical protein